MPIGRHTIPPLGLAPRGRATLLSTAIPIPEGLVMDGKVPRWLAGIQFQQLGCNPLTRIESLACDPLPEDKSANELGEIIAFDSFTIYDALVGASICTDLERLDDDILIRMPAMVSEQLANELMEGGARAYSGAEPLVNPSFVTSAAVGYGGPFFPNDALAVLEQAAADTIHGAQATMHLTPRGLSTLNFLDQGEYSDEGWTTAQGHIVVADAGYTGPEPDANGGIVADEWWYMSGPVGVILTQPEPLGMPFERMNYATNQLTNIYEGFALVAYDPCAVVAVPVLYDDVVT